MSKFLKGNYEIEGVKNGDDDIKSKQNSVTEVFEKQALEKLGGSIAFVIKGKNFVWQGEDENT